MRINLTQKDPANTTLGSFGLDLKKCERIGKYLDKTFKISFDRDDIPDLTIAKLQNMGEQTLKDDSKTSLSTYFTKVDPEELDSSLSLIIMPSLIMATKQKYEQFDGQESYMVIIPGLEGHYGLFQRVCERLMMPAIVLQPALENANDTVEDAAAKLIEVMMKNIYLKNKKFYLLGYSFGAIVALEMARILEEQGLEGIVYCFDSAPGVFQRQLSRVIGNMREDELQNAIAEQMYTLMTHDDLDALKKELNEAQTWKDKVNISMRHLSGRVPYSAQYARLLIEAAYGRICAAKKYNPNNLVARPLRAQIVLLKSKVPAELLDVPHDFGLSSCSQRNPIVYELDCNHVSILQDFRCSNIVNRHLGDDIHEQFSQRNLCVSYIDNLNNMFGTANEQ